MTTVNHQLGLKSILLATDFSEASARPLRHALAIARHYGARLYLTHVVSPSMFAPSDPEVRNPRREAVCSNVQDLEHDLLRNGELDGISYEVLLREGELWEELENTIEQEHVDLVVVGTRGHQGLGKLILGSLAEQILRQASCPVLTVGPGSPENTALEDTNGVRSVLFATDFEAASLHALEYAVSFATEYNARLILMHVITQVQIPAKFKNCWIYGSDVTQWRKEARLASLRRLEELVSDRDELPFAPEFVVEECGLPAEAILQTAKSFHADLIVMGLRPSTHITSASHVPWTIAYQVVCGAACPVLTTQGNRV